MTHTIRWVFVLCLGASFATIAWGQDYASLWVEDPKNPWHHSPGTIEEATLAIRPQGIYMAYDLYLTFSARHSDFSASDTLEVVFQFSLPEEAMFTDSWLWVGEEPVEALLLDRWTASNIYEGIVQRRRDPSILTKHGPGDYELRIFPMAGNETRKVKLTYLTPTHWTAETVQAQVPTHFLTASTEEIPDLRVITWPDAQWTQPRLSGDQWTWTFAELNEEEPFGEVWSLLIDDANMRGGLTFTVDAPLTDGMFVSRLDEQGEGWYQLVLLPSVSGAAREQQKVAVVLDYDNSYTDVSLEQVAQQTEQALRNYLTPADSFMVMWSELRIQQAGETWLPADSSTLAAAFQEATAWQSARYANIPGLLAQSMDFVRDQGDGMVLLVSGSADFADLERTNQLLDDLQDLHDPMPPTFILDITTHRLPRFFAGNVRYDGNAYLYTNLARLTGGEYVALRTEPRIKFAIHDLLLATSGSIHSMDIYTTLENGFCFGRISSWDGLEAVHPNQPVFQVGQYFGSMPFVVEVSGIFEGTTFSQQMRLPEAALATADSSLIQYWTGRQIDRLERSSTANDLIGEIINYSLDARVLSQYTAFLALEPGMEASVCTTCQTSGPGGDGGGTPVTLATSQELPQDAVLDAFPNPFHDRATIRVALPSNPSLGTVSLAIYNSMGQRIRMLPVMGEGTTAFVEVEWDGMNDIGEAVASGTYFVVLSTPEGRKTLSLVLVR